jgi:hypothetical protein
MDQKKTYLKDRVNLSKNFAAKKNKKNTQIFFFIKIICRFAYQFFF